MTRNSFSAMLISRFGGVMFIVGKTLRFTVFLFFLLTVLGSTKTLIGYTPSEVIFFFLTFNFVDTITQCLFREVYRFRYLIVSGNFDLVLAKPVNPLFRSLLGGADLLDCFMLIPYTIALVIVGSTINPTNVEILEYVILLVCGVIVSMSFHILVLSLGVITTEVDHAIMMYRDVANTGRVPIDIYSEPLRSVLTYVVPVAVMFTIPVKALLGLISPEGIIGVSLITGVFFFLSLHTWNESLKRYTSASS